jgi:hypothetical protein
LGLAIGLASLTGCASILEGPRQTIRVHCNPSSGIGVLVDGMDLPFEGATIQLDKKRDTHFVTFGKQGYQPTTISFNREVNPVWLVADLIWGPAFPIAWLVDWMSAALFRIDPRDIYVVLRKTEGEAIEKK